MGRTKRNRKNSSTGYRTNDPMNSNKQNETTPLPQMSRDEEERLIAVWKLLKDLAQSEYPAVQAGCEKARSEIWQVIFELGLKVEDEE
jgi:hypothetical protein